MNVRPIVVNASRDAVALARCYQRDDHQAAGDLTARLTATDQAVALQAAANLLAQAVERLAQLTRITTNGYWQVMIAALDDIAAEGTGR